MNDLFGDRGKPSTKEAMRFDWLNAYCRDRFGVADEWRWFTWSRKEFDTPHEFILVTGAVCTAKFEKGKRKGQTNWKLRDKTTERMFSVSRRELEVFEREWSAKTGLCFECQGTGEKWIGWGCDTGNRYKPCPSCNATGHAKKLELIAS